MKRRGIISRFVGLKPIHREFTGKEGLHLSLLILFLFITGAGVFAQADRKYIRKGNGNYNDGNYKQAELEYRKALEDNPSSSKADYNLGNSLYKQGQFEAAAGRYNSLISSGHAGQSSGATSATPDLSRHYYNLGNALFQSQKYRESIEAYKMALRNNPSDLDAKHNLQLALRLMHEAEQQKQQGGNNRQDQDKEKQDKQQQQQQQQQDKQQQQQQDKDQKQDQQQPQQDQDQQEDNQQPQDQGQDQQQYKGINPQDTERILDALESQEKQTLRNVQDKKANRQMEVEKNW